MIPHSKPSITELEIESVLSALKSGNISSQAGITEKFEKEFAKKFKYSHAVAVNSGSSALFLLLKAIGIKDGDRVGVPDYSFIATANAVAQCGAEPIPIDCDYSYNISPEKLDEKLRDHLDAVIIVHTYGIPCDMAAIMALQEKYNFLLIEDCCEALGTKEVGEYGDGAVYSFFANKTITTGEGGMICTNNEVTADLCRSYRNYCKSDDNPYVHTDIGYNLRLTSLQAALGLAQLKRFKDLLNKRKDEVYVYERELDSRVKILPQDGSSYWAFPIYIENPKELADFLRKKGIETRGGFCPIHLQKPYARKGLYRNSEDIYKHTLLLPLYYDLTEKDQEYIADSINTFYEQKRNS